VDPSCSGMKARPHKTATPRPFQLSITDIKFIIHVVQNNKIISLCQILFTIPKNTQLSFQFFSFKVGGLMSNMASLLSGSKNITFARYLTYQQKKKWKQASTASLTPEKNETKQPVNDVVVNLEVLISYSKVFFPLYLHFFVFDRITSQIKLNIYFLDKISGFIIKLNGGFMKYFDFILLDYSVKQTPTFYVDLYNISGRSRGFYGFHRTALEL